LKCVCEKKNNIQVFVVRPCFVTNLWSDSEVRVLLSQSLFAALLEQTYEDTSLSATGYLGGYTQRTTIVVDDQKRECLLCFICDLVASER
jgi:hypothetical protein